MCNQLYINYDQPNQSCNAYQRGMNCHHHDGDWQFDFGGRGINTINNVIVFIKTLVPLDKKQEMVMTKSDGDSGHCIKKNPNLPQYHVSRIE